MPFLINRIQERTMKTPIPSLALVLAALGTAQAAQPGFLSLQAETMAMSMDDRITSANALVASNRLGLRVSPSEKLSFDVLAGFGHMEGHGADTATDTDESAPTGLYSVEAGIAWKVAQGEKASLSLLGQGGVTVFQTSASSYSTMTYQRKELGYSLTVPSLFVGIEPAVDLAPNFQLYSTVGVRYGMIPNSKHAPSTSSGEEPHLETKKDATNVIGLSGLSLGMRYVF
jgi:opacity protein-like surface antigen